MASDTNSVVLVGRLTDDAASATFKNGSTVFNFSVAVNRSVKDGEQWKTEASFFEVKHFAAGESRIAGFLTKGRQVGLTGELRQEKWEKDGKKYSKVVVVARSVQLLASGKDEAAKVSEAAGEAAAKVVVAKKAAANDGFKDEIPF